jgi:hypothetical protein
LPFVFLVPEPRTVFIGKGVVGERGTRVIRAIFLSQLHDKHGFHIISSLLSNIAFAQPRLARFLRRPDAPSNDNVAHRAYYLC